MKEKSLHLYPPEVPIYRPNVAALILNRDNKIFLGERVDSPGSWQIPQGGIKFRQNELPRDALWRELQEELGLEDPQKDLTILDEYHGWLRYDFPDWLQAKGGKFAKYKGQIQKYFLLRYHGRDDMITLEHKGVKEFQNFRWSDPEMMHQSVASFKVEVMKTAFIYFQSRNGMLFKKG